MRVRALALVLVLASSGPWMASASFDAGGERAALDYVAYGDSFTAPYKASFGEGTETNWATGSDPATRSVAARLAQEGPWPVRASNLAVVGARFGSLPGEVQAGPVGADLVTVFMGLNDVCWPDPDPAEAFEARVEEGFASVRAAHPSALVVVFAIPDVARLAELHADRAEVRAMRDGIQYCADVFDPPPGAAAAEFSGPRRDAFNRILEGEAAAFGFQFSDATEWPGFSTTDLSQRDFFHPSAPGHARLAQTTYSTVQALGPFGNRLG